MARRERRDTRNEEESGEVGKGEEIKRRESLHLAVPSQSALHSCPLLPCSSSSRESVYSDIKEYVIIFTFTVIFTIIFIESL